MKQYVIPVPSLDGSVLGVQMCAVSARAAKGFIGRLRGIHGVPNGLIWLPPGDGCSGMDLTRESLVGLAGSRWRSLGMAMAASRAAGLGAPALRRRT